jgi:hypothetical protein
MRSRIVRTTVGITQCYHDVVPTSTHKIFRIACDDGVSVEPSDLREHLPGI